MELFNVLLEDHAALRRSLAALSRELGAPAGCGWDDRAALDPRRFRRDVKAFLSALKRHEAREEAWLVRPLRQAGASEARAVESLDRAHKTLDDLVSLFQATARSCDGKHVYGLRWALSLLGEGLERHLAEEETTLFPRLRHAWTHGLRRELGRRADGAAVAPTRSRAPAL